MVQCGQQMRSQAGDTGHEKREREQGDGNKSYSKIILANHTYRIGNHAYSEPILADHLSVSMGIIGRVNFACIVYTDISFQNFGGYSFDVCKLIPYFLSMSASLI